MMLKFEKVSREQFENKVTEILDVEPFFAKLVYDEIKLPRRATTASAGYDFFSPYGFELLPGQSILIPTGIRMIAEPGVVGICAPRSGHGFKYRIQLDNTIGVIDADYWKSDNEGHIMAKLTNDGREGKALYVNTGDAFMQCILIPYLVTDDDNAVGIRNGGFGSTGA